MGSLFSAEWVVEGFLKAVSPHVPNGYIPDNNIPEPWTPTGATVPPTSATKLPAPKCSRVQKFGEIEIPPISLYASQGKLAALLNDEELNDSLSNNNTGWKEDNEEKDRVVLEGKKENMWQRGCAVKSSLELTSTKRIN